MSGRVIAVLGLVQMKDGVCRFGIGGYGGMEAPVILSDVGGVSMSGTMRFWVRTGIVLSNRNIIIVRAGASTPHFGLDAGFGLSTPSPLG